VPADGAHSVPNYGFVLAPRPNIFEAQLAFCQFVEFSPDLYIDCFIAAANPDPDSAGVDFGCANGIALGTQDVQYFGVLHHWLLLLRSSVELLVILIVGGLAISRKSRAPRR
jgi:hypothetical protein